MTDFIPLRRMQDRIALDRDDSESAYFASILYGYEFAIKLVTSAFVAAIGDDTDRYRYRLEHGLVRASGIGDWVTALNEVFTGPSSAQLDTKAREHRNEITAKVADGDWRYEATKLLRAALIELAIESEQQPGRAQLLQWFRDFALLRNKTRGHGAPSQTRLANACEPLAVSLSLIMDNLSLFSIPWAFIRRNLSLKYRVCPFGNDDTPFAHMRSQKDLCYEDGVYISLDVLHRCCLVHTDQDLSDFFVANGGFTDQKYEILSYISGEIQHASSASYLKPADRLPGSSTEGSAQLDILGQAFSNLPTRNSDYVQRESLEELLRAELVTTSHHPIVTLDGRGGIGKTSTALNVIADLACSPDCPYTVILWFSARDIDLLPEGAKLVRPSGITIDDFANQYATLLELEGRESKKFNARQRFAEALSGESTEPTLFVFDNFETVVSPAETFGWIDTYARSPNKVLITTRIRGNFKADFPIHVDGMTDSECETLVLSTAQRLGIRGRVDREFTTSVIAESEGHPYVIKVLLGEVARSPNTRKVMRVMASRDDILEALFERTFNVISPAARRVFLTLAGWRSVVPELAVEAVVVRPGNEKMDIHEAIQELINSSLVDEVVATDDEYFLSVPLAAQVFGQKKLKTSPHRGSITEDINLLQQFGAAQKHDVCRGLEARLNVLFRNIATLVASGERTLEECLPIVEYVARKVPKAWLYLADLCEESMDDADTYVRNCLVRYLEGDGRDDTRAWRRVADLFGKAGMIHDEINALVSLAKAPDVPVLVLSNAANRVNGLLRETATGLDQQDRRQLVRELAEAMNARRADCDATGLSRLAWLYLSLGEVDKAKDTVKAGLQSDPNNPYCQNLKQRLDNQG